MHLNSSSVSVAKSCSDASSVYSCSSLARRVSEGPYGKPQGPRAPPPFVVPLSLFVPYSYSTVRMSGTWPSEKPPH